MKLKDFFAIVNSNSSITYTSERATDGGRARVLIGIDSTFGLNVYAYGGVHSMHSVRRATWNAFRMIGAYRLIILNPSVYSCVVSF